MKIEIQAELLESEVIWGKKFIPLVQQLFSLEFELYCYLTNYLRSMDPDEDPDARNGYNEVNKKVRKVLYSMTDESKDPFAKEFNSAVVAIERELREKLKK